MDTDIPYATRLADYRQAILAELRGQGLAASQAIALVRREIDTVEISLDNDLSPRVIAACLMVLLED